MDLAIVSALIAYPRLNKSRKKLLQSEVLIFIRKVKAES